MKTSATPSDLYQKYLSNSCTAAELQELLSQFDEANPDSELKSMILQELERSGSNYENLPQIDVLLRKLDNVVYAEVIDAKIKPIRKFSYSKVSYWSAAAIALLILSITYYSITKFNLSNPQVSVYKNDVKPGITKAYLTLADGKRIELNQSLNGNIATQAGIRIIKTQSGQVRYEFDKGNENIKVNAYNTLTTPKGGKYEVLLSDGTKVFLNAASSLRFPTHFSNKGNREVELIGEGYFEVAHLAQQPFFVKSGSQRVKVLGTHFNVNAYSDEKSIKTTLMEGSVKVDYPNGLNATLKPGQQSQLNNGQVEVLPVDVRSVIDWKTGEMNLNDGDLSNTMRKIARWYDVDVVFAEGAPTDLKLGGLVSREKNIITVLKVLELTGEVHFKVEGRRVLVMR